VSGSALFFGLRRGVIGRSIPAVAGQRLDVPGALLAKENSSFS